MRLVIRWIRLFCDYVLEGIIFIINSDAQVYIGKWLQATDVVHILILSDGKLVLREQKTAIGGADC